MALTVEIQFLVGLDFDLLISPKQLSALRSGVERIIARYVVHIGDEEGSLCHAAIGAVKSDITACATTGDARGTCS